MIREDGLMPSEPSINARESEIRKPERDGARRGRGPNQQVRTCDRISLSPHLFTLLKYRLQDVVVSLWYVAPNWGYWFGGESDKSSNLKILYE
jgi:hypothetical protein